MRTMGFGHPGDDGLGERLLSAVLRGAKTATSSLVVEYLDGEPLPRVGERLALVDHAGHCRGVVVTTRVAVLPLSTVGDDVAHDEGEGFTDSDDWRRAHTAYWAEIAEDVRVSAGDPGWALREHEPVVVEWFRLVEDAPPAHRTTVIGSSTPRAVSTAGPAATSAGSVVAHTTW